MLEFWFLVHSYTLGQTQSREAVAKGPYPSREMCRLAAKNLIPEDRQFWTLKERTEAEMKDQQRAAARATELAKKKAALPVGKAATIRLSDGTDVDIDATGKETSWGVSSGGYIVMGGYTFYTAITGCTTIARESK